MRWPPTCARCWPPTPGRRPPLLERARRLLRRHRAMALAAALGGLGLGSELAAALMRGQAVLALGLALGATGLVLAAWQWRRARAAQARADGRFEQLRRLTRALVYTHHDRIALLPGSTAVREPLLRDAADTLATLAPRDGAAPDPALVRDLAKTHLRLAVLYGESFSPSLERLDLAEAELERALALQPLYLDSPGLPPEALHAATDMWLARTTQHVRRGRLRPALAALEKARALAERALAAAPDDAQTVSRLATVEGRQGMLLGHHVMEAQLGRSDEALPHLQRAAERLRTLHARWPDDAEWAHQTAWAEQNLALVLLLRGEPAAAVAAATRAVALRDMAAALAPDNAHLRHQRFSVRSTLAQALVAAGRADEAGVPLAEAAAVVQASAAADPGNRAAARDVVALDAVAARLHARQLLAGDGAAAEGVAAGRPAHQAAVARLAAVRQRLDALRADGPRADFYLDRIEAELLLWQSRVARAGDPAAALDAAAQARALMAPVPGDADNAARAWAHAQALGEEAAALADLASPAAAAHPGAAARAAAVAAAAVQAWAAAPGTVPPLLQPWREAARRLAQPPAATGGAAAA